MKNLTTLVLAVALCVAAGCKKAAPTRPGQTPNNGNQVGPLKQDPAAYKEFVILEVASGAPRVGTLGAATLTWKTKPPYKWNAQYHSSLKITHFEGLTLPRSEFASKDFKVGKQGAVLTLPFQPKRNGKVTISALANLSVCTDTLCKILREQTVELNFNVK